LEGIGRKKKRKGAKHLELFFEPLYKTTALQGILCPSHGVEQKKKRKKKES